MHTSHVQNFFHMPWKDFHKWFTLTLILLHFQMQGVLTDLKVTLGEGGMVECLTILTIHNFKKFCQNEQCMIYVRNCKWFLPTKAQHSSRNSIKFQENVIQCSTIQVICSLTFIVLQVTCPCIHVCQSRDFELYIPRYLACFSAAQLRCM